MRSRRMRLRERVLLTRNLSVPIFPEIVTSKGGIVRVSYLFLIFKSIERTIVMASIALFFRFVTSVFAR